MTTRILPSTLGTKLSIPEKVNNGENSHMSKKYKNKEWIFWKLFVSVIGPLLLWD
jgi:hypothetical protein